MNNILLISNTLKKEYESALHCITGYFTYRTQNNFIDYILKQHNVFELEELANENTKKVAIKLQECLENNQELFLPNTGLSVKQTYRLLGKYYFLNTPLYKEYTLITDSLNTTIRNLNFVNKQFIKKESPSILGNNWRLQKAFPSLNTSKTKNDKYILPEVVVTDIISNYFLYIKFNGELYEPPTY